MSLISKDKVIVDLANAYRTASGTSEKVKIGELADKISALSGSSSDPVIMPIEITENGTYTASEGIDGYSPITVNVQGASLPEKGLVFENYDSNGDPTTARFVGEWSGALSKMADYFKPTVYLGKITSLTIPEGISVISPSVFYNCSSLKTILLPKTVTTILSHAFFASGITSITLPKSLVTIDGISHFNNCYNLSTVIFEGHCPNIPQYCFWKCNNINYFDFSNCTSVPTLYSAGSLGHASGCVIKVPSALLSEWQNATNWVDLTDVIWEGV